MMTLENQVLFLHTNYPAQFRFLVKAYSANKWDVWFASHTKKHEILPQIKYIKLNSGTCKGSKLDQQQRKSVIVFYQLLHAKRNLGLNPKRIYIHTGWGLGAFVKELFPKSLVFAYSEWWFNLFSEDYLFDPNNSNVSHSLDSKLFSLLRNQGFAFELMQADVIITPTKWQCQQLPENFREKANVIFDGIDPKMFSPGPQEIDLDKFLPGVDQKVPLLTYATRGLEPYRGFPEFVKAAAYLLQSDPNWQIAIAGTDSANYHKNKNSPKRGYGAEAMDYFKSIGVSHRVHMLGTLPFGAYRDLLRRSNLHCYFTRPYVLSWSLLESAITGCSLFVSNTKPVAEFLENDEGTILVDHTAKDLGVNLLKAATTIRNKSISPFELRKSRESLLEIVSVENCIDQHFALAKSFDQSRN